jgi:hypothetical protein
MVEIRRISVAGQPRQKSLPDSILMEKTEYGGLWFQVSLP